MADLDKIKFHYIKGNFFRVIHVDGAFGGISPTGEIFFSLFSQRPPIPQLTVQQVKEDGELGDEIVSERVTKDGLVRELEIGVSMRPEVAETLIKFLQERVDIYHKMAGQKEEEKEQKTNKIN
jgi:hypothetical protein